MELSCVVVVGSRGFDIVNAESEQGNLSSVSEKNETEKTMSKTKEVKASKEVLTKRPRRKAKKFVPREGAFVVEVIRRKSNGQRVGVLVGELLRDRVYIQGAKCAIGEDRFDYGHGVRTATTRIERTAEAMQAPGAYSHIAIGAVPLAASLVPYMSKFVERCIRYFRVKKKNIVLPTYRTFRKGVVIAAEQIDTTGVKASPKQLSYTPCRFLVEGREGR